MKKSLQLLTIFLIGFLILNFISTLRADISDDAPAIPNTGKVPVLGDMNPETGQPRTFEQFQQFADNVSNAEQNKSYLVQQWSIILAKTPYVGPFLFYTENFFSFLNPLWNLIFGINFAWSFAFFVTLGIWLMFIFIFYSPSKNLTNFNPILALIFSIVLASIMGTIGVISSAVNKFGFVITSFIVLVICLVIAILLVWLYTKIFKEWGKKMKEDAKKEKLERSEEKINATGKVAGKFLEE
jgi:hypothetical protein